MPPSPERRGGDIGIVSRLRLKKHHTEVLFAIANGVEPGVNPLVLYKTCTSLEEMGFLKREGRGKYTIADPFLRIYLTRQLPEIQHLREKAG